MAREIIEAWESPRNEMSAAYIVGYDPPGQDWQVGTIVMQTITTERRIDGELTRYKRSRVDIFDTEDQLRVSLPTEAVAVEYAYEEGKEDTP